MDSLPPAYLPLVEKILVECSIVMPAKCGAVADPSKPEYSCSQCAAFAESLDLMVYAPLCLGGSSPECCAAVSPLKVEPCVHSMMDGMPAAFIPLVTQILDGCSIVLPTKCPAAAPAGRRRLLENAGRRRLLEAAAPATCTACLDPDSAACAYVF
jgi:hypothetical protein